MAIAEVWDGWDADAWRLGSWGASTPVLPYALSATLRPVHAMSAATRAEHALSATTAPEHAMGATLTPEL